MPFVNVQTVKGMLDERQKSELLSRITELLVEIEGRGDPAFRQSVWVESMNMRPNNGAWAACSRRRR